MDGSTASPTPVVSDNRPGAAATPAATAVGTMAGRRVERTPGAQQETTRRELVEAGGTPSGSPQRAADRRAVAEPSRATATGPVAGRQSPRQAGGGQPPAPSTGEQVAPYVASCGPPWLTESQRAELETKHRRLFELAKRIPDTTTRDNLLMAALLVRVAEEALSEAHDLLQSAGTQPLSIAQRRRLGVQLRANLLDMPMNYTEVLKALVALVDTGALSAADSALAEDLHTRLDSVYDYLRACGPTWRGPARRIETTLPLGDGKPAVVDWHVLAGKALGAYLPGSYPLPADAGEACGVRHFYAPDLALAALCDGKGQVLYFGLSHSLFHAHELTGDHVAGLSDRALQSVLFQYYKRLFSSLYADAPVPVSRLPPIMPVIRENDERERIRSLSADALASWTQALQKKAVDSAYGQVINIALLPFASEQSPAFADREVGLNLFCIAMLAPEDAAAWQLQHDCYRRAKSIDICPFGLDEQVDAGRVTVRVSTRQFALSVTQPSPTADSRPDIGRAETERLLGPMDSACPGGDVKAALDTLQSAISRSRDRLEASARHHASVAQTSGADHPQAQHFSRHLARQQDHLQRLEKGACALVDATRQLKTLWAESGDWPAGGSAYRKAAARLAVVGFLMGELPLLICASGRDCTARLEEDIRFLATYADNQDGHLPPLDLPEEAWRDARAAFALQ